ncbi:MAG: TolC family protein [Polaromonas sp.]|uniref:TolC family protein n=1 Tax=Polaromonas sp. TaxID=1869339 RepID=UPI0025F8FCF1|nr:TolC family protein [Polaromonas sp.]MBI2728496.1 TolC family protein [Polaromonas sp.]
MSFSFRIWRCAASALVASMVFSAWSAEPLTLLEAQLLAVNRSQQLAAQDAGAVAVREQALAAGQLPDPVLKLGVDNLPANGPDRFSVTRDFMTMRRIGLSQEIPRAEKRQLRTERVERDGDRIRAQRRVTLANVQRDTALAWLDRHYAQAQRNLLQQQVEEARLQVQAADSAFRSNRGSQADVFAARAAVSMLQDRLSQIDRQSRNAGLMLGRWVGATNAERPTSGSPPWQATPLEGALSNEQLKLHPELMAIGAEVDAAETEARLAQANKKSDISVEASYAQRGPAYSNMLSFGISIPLQWDQANRQDRELSAKLATVNEAKARYEDALRSYEAQVQSWLSDWQTGKERLLRYRDELIPLAHQRTEATLTAYRTGKADLAAGLLARRDEIDVRLQALVLEMETARSWAQLNFLVGNSQPATPAKDRP